MCTILKKTVQKVRVVNGDNIMNFTHSLAQESWDLTFNAYDVNTKLNNFLYIFQTHFEECFPIKIQKKGRNNNLWITQGIKISCRKKRILYIESRNKSDTNLKLYYKQYCKILNNVIKVAKRLHYKKLINQSENKIKATWDIIIRETKKQTVDDSITVLNVDGKETSDPIRVANEFNTFFLNVTENLNTNCGGKDDAIHLLNVNFNQNFSGFNIFPSTEVEIINVIRSLKSKNSSGYDEISSKIIKSCPFLISAPLNLM